MRKLANLTLAAILTCGTSLFVACSFEDQPVYNDGAKTIVAPEEPTTDQLAVKVTADMPTAVLSSFSEKSMGSALIKRLSKTTTEINADTKLVLVKGDDLGALSSEVQKQMVRVYLNNGYIALERATNLQVVGFAIGLGLAIKDVQSDILEENGVEVTGNDVSGTRSYTNDLQRRVANARALTRAVDDEEEDPDGIDFEMIIVSLNKCFTQAPYHAEKTMTSTCITSERSQKTYEEKVVHPQNSYHYGLLADGAADYLNLEEKEKVEAVAESRASTRSAGETAMNQALNCSDEFVINHALYARDPHGKQVIRQNMATTTIKSWSVHDFGSKQDFYYVDEKVVVRMGGQNSDYNKTLYWGPYHRNEWYGNQIFDLEGHHQTISGGYITETYTDYYGSWLSQIKHSLNLRGNGTITVEASLPTTANSSESQTIAVGTTDTTSETSGWNIGVSADNKGAKFNFGYSSSTTNTHSNSFSMSHTSVSSALKVTRNTVGTQVTFDYQEGVRPDWTWDPFQHDMAPDILTNDCEVNNMVCWRVKDPSDGYKLEISTIHHTKCMCVANYLNNKHGEYWIQEEEWSDTYNLKQPCRFMGKWTCEIKTSGEKVVDNASNIFRKYLQEAVAETPFKTQFNVAEMKQGETSVMAGIIHTVSDTMKEGTRKRQMIDNHAKELGIDSYNITWFSDDVSTEYQIKGELKK